MNTTTIPRSRLALGALSFAIASWTIASTAAAGPTNRALLVGVSDYVNLKNRNLEGPPNDIALFRKFLLSGRFAPFSDANIIVLAGDRKAPVARRPMRANIERAFHQLASDAGPGDQVVILMAGHGSQQPANDDPANDEPDGLDETFLPADVGAWDGKLGVVKNAIVDDDIARWLADIRKKGAFVWVLFDSCHSGTMTRGIERQRGIAASELVDPAALARAISRARQSHTSNSEAPLATPIAAPDDASAPGGLVAMYAVQADQTTPEMPLGDKDTWYGLFTYTVVSLLEQADEALSYRELIERVNERYRALSRMAETPAFEGSAAARAVLGREALPDRPPFLLDTRTRDGNGWTLMAGEIQGVTLDSVLAVYPPAGGKGSSEAIGYVRVETAGATRSTVQPAEFAGHPAPAAIALIPGSRCRLARLAVGGSVLWVGATRPSAALASALAALNERTLGAATSTSEIDRASWIALEDPATHNVLLEQVSAVADRRRIFVARADDPDLPGALAGIAATIARSNALHGLASPTHTRGGTATTIRLDTTALVYDGPGSTHGHPLETGSAGRVLRVGQEVEFRVKNTGQSDANVTVLFLDADYGVTMLFPRADRQLDVRVKPGQEVVIGRFPVTNQTLGDEDLLVIGLTPMSRPVDLSILAQPPLQKGDAVRTGELSRGDRLSLSDLLSKALGASRTRDLGGPVLMSDDEQVASLFSWRTVDGKP